MKSIHSLISWSFVIANLLALSACTSRAQSVDCQELIISPIADQEVLAGTRSYIAVSVLASPLEDITYRIPESHSFISIEETQRGRAALTIDASPSDLGQHTTTIEVSDGSHSACISFVIKIIETEAIAKVIHCDPNQTEKGNGSIESPYPALANLLESGYKPQAKDVIVLHRGNHGAVSLSGRGYHVHTKNGHKARMTSLEINNAQNLSISGIEVRPQDDHGDHNQYLVFIDSSCQQIYLNNSQIISTHDADLWTQDDWNKKASRGIKCLADKSVIKNNLVQNIFHGIKTEGDSISVLYNHVDRFGGDAVRNTGSHNSYEYNFLSNATVADYYDEEGNHDDLFQSWTFGDPVDNVSLSFNIMISCIDTLMPQRAKIVQGLVCFDGFETNWLVNDNLVVTDHPHGIALYGAINCEITNNMVLKNPHDLYQYESDPWIMINNHKDGRESKNNRVNNNISSSLNIVSKDVSTVNNTVLDSTSLQKLYNYDQWDFRIKD